MKKSELKKIIKEEIKNLLETADDRTSPTPRGKGMIIISNDGKFVINTHVSPPQKTPLKKGMDLTNFIRDFNKISADHIIKYYGKKGTWKTMEVPYDYNTNRNFEGVVKEDYDNSIYVKGKDLKRIGWIVINKRKNDGRPLYTLESGDDKSWGATYRMGTSKHSESSPLFYTIPIKVEGTNRFRMLTDDEKWSRAYAYEEIEIKK